MSEAAPRHLITTLYGLYARAQQDWLSVASLVRLMEDLDVDAAAVRSSVSRLKKRDVLRSVKHDGRAGYALSPTTVEMLREGDDRIWSRPRATVEDGWLVVVFSVPESEREKRHALRSQLSRLGFGSAAPGVWVAPGTSYEEVVHALDRLGLTAYTEFFRGDYLGAGDVASRMAQWWDLDEMTRRYVRFVARLRGAAGRRPRTGRRLPLLRADADRLAATALPRPRSAPGAPARRLGRAGCGGPVRRPRRDAPRTGGRARPVGPARDVHHRPRQPMRFRREHRHSPRPGLQRPVDTLHRPGLGPDHAWLLGRVVHPDPRIAPETSPSQATAASTAATTSATTARRPRRRRADRRSTRDSSPVHVRGQAARVGGQTGPESLVNRHRRTPPRSSRTAASRAGPGLGAGAA